MFQAGHSVDDKLFDRFVTAAKLGLAGTNCIHHCTAALRNTPSTDFHAQGLMEGSGSAGCASTGEISPWQKARGQLQLDVGRRQQWSALPHEVVNRWLRLSIVKTEVPQVRFMSSKELRECKLISIRHSSKAPLGWDELVSITARPGP